MTIIHPYTDSYLFQAFDEASVQFPYVHYPPYAATYLRDFVAHLVSVSKGSLAPLLTSLTEPSLYTLAAALTPTLGGDEPLFDQDLRDALVAELRWRNCKAMGTDPTGPVRRGRLIQLVATCTSLDRAGASSLQRDNLAGDCPFCGASEFRVFLPAVRWRCFACAREGALLEFAEALLEMV